MKVRMTNKARKTAKSFAIAYGAYAERAAELNKARKTGTVTPKMLNSIAVWARVFADRLEEMGLDNDFGGYKPSTLRIYAANRDIERDKMDRMAA